MTLPDAMKKVLLAGPQEEMHSVDIANEITSHHMSYTLKKMVRLLMESKLYHVQIITKIFLFVYLVI